MLFNVPSVLQRYGDVASFNRQKLTEKTLQSEWTSWTRGKCGPKQDVHPVRRSTRTNKSIADQSSIVPSRANPHGERGPISRSAAAGIRRLASATDQNPSKAEARRADRVRIDRSGGKTARVYGGKPRTPSKASSPRKRLDRPL